MNDFDKKIFEARVKQSNRKWLTKEIVIGLVWGLVAVVVIGALTR